MTDKKRNKALWRPRLLALAVASSFSAEVAYANPAGPAVTHGSATFVTEGNKLTVINSPGAIINWQSFSIPSQNVTQFLQQSAASAVLNRVTGATPSTILGQLLSNGRVFLINPNGITIGQGAVIDVAGFVASTLNLSDADFIAGRHRFAETPGAGDVINQGTIKTPSGGRVYLVGQNVENHGIIKTPQGEIVLAAGKTVELVDAGTPEIRVQVTAPDNQALNLGELLASGGSIGMYAGLVRHGGTASADTAVVGENGKIIFKATRSVKLEAGSKTTASGPTAGSVRIEADTGTASIAGTVEASATAARGGNIEVSGQQGIVIEPTARLSAAGVEGGRISLASGAGAVEVAGQLNADARSGRGGEVAITAAGQASLAAGARVTASGAQGGGSISITAGAGVKVAAGAEAQSSGSSGGTIEVAVEQGSAEINGIFEAAGSEATGAGGKIRVSALTDITLGHASALVASGGTGGTVRIEARDGATLAYGLIEAFGNDGRGGKALLLGPRVGLVGNARLNVSGRKGGGEALVGGDFQGNNPDIRNAERTYVGPDALITADAIEAGDGGKVVIWADDWTRFYGTIRARGGAQAGNGGFVEVSGKEILNFFGRVDVGAAAGSAGTILLDPRNIIIADTVAGGGDNAQVVDGSVLFADGASANTDFTISDEALEALTGNVVLQATQDITISSGLSGGGLLLLNQSSGQRVVFQAGRHVTVNSPVRTNGAAIWLEADSPHVNGYPVSTSTSGAEGTGALRINAEVRSFNLDSATGGKITLLAGSNANQGQSGGGFTLNADVNAGAGGIDVALTTEGTGELSFFIGSQGQAQFTSSDTGQLKSTGQLKIGEATTAGTDGLGSNAITIKVDQLSIGTTAGGPVSLAESAGTSLVLTAGDGGILVDKPLETSQDTTIDTTGPLTVSNTGSITTDGDLSITAASISGADSISTTGDFTCSGTGCPGTVVIFWDGGGGTLDWFTAANWSGNAVPSDSDAVVILNSNGPIVISGGTAFAKSLIADVPLEISSTGSLNLTQASQFTQNLYLSGSLLGNGAVAVSGGSGVLSWTSGAMGSGGSFTLGVGASGSLSGTLTLDRPFQNSGALTLMSAVVNGAGAITNAGSLTAALGTSSINVALFNPASATIQILGSLTATQFPQNEAAIVIRPGGTFSTGGELLVNSSTSRIIVEGGNFSTAEASVATDSGTGNMDVGGTLSAGTILLVAGVGGGFTLNAGSAVTAVGSGDSIVISGASFTNHGGPSVLNAGSGRWLIYTANPSGNTFGGLASGNRAVWGSSYPAAVPETGNRYVFADDGAVTVTTIDASKVYGDVADVAAHFVLSGDPFNAAAYGNAYVNEAVADVFAIAASANSAGSVATASVAGGPYAITGSGTANTGFAVSFVNSGLLTVSARPITVAGDDLSSIYGDPNPVLTYTVAADGIGASRGLANGDTLAGSLATTATVTSDVGAYAIAQGTLTNVNNPNYTISYVNGTLTVTPAALTVTANDASKVYGQTLTFNGTEFTVTGLKNGESIGGVTLASSGAAPTANVAGSPYAIIPSVATGGTFNAGNYTISYFNGALTVTPAVITLAGIREYDGTTSFGAGAFGAVVGGNGETLTLNGAGSVASSKVLAGTQALTLGTLSLGDGTGLASNYTLSGGAHTGAITPSVAVPFAWDPVTAVDLSWGNPANWNQGAVPVNGASASIPSGLGGPVVYSSGATSLVTVTSGSGLMLAGGTLNLGNSAADVSSFSGQPLTLAGGTLGGPGTISLAGTTLDILAGGVLNGARAVIGDVNNHAGVVSPGASPGTLTINGDYVQGAQGTLAIEVGGPAAGTQYDQVIVTGNAMLDGTLDVTLIGGFVPVAGDTFTVIETGGTLSGTFATASLPAAPSLTTRYLASSVDVAVAVPLNIERVVRDQIDASHNAIVSSNESFISNSPILPHVGDLQVFVNLDTGETVYVTTEDVLQPGNYRRLGICR